MNSNLNWILTIAATALMLCGTASAQTPTKSPLPRAATIPLFLNGKQVGTTTLPAGTLVEVVSENDQELVARHMGQEIRVSKTNTPEPAAVAAPKPANSVPAPDSPEVNQLKKQAEKGDIAAQLELGNIYREGKGVAKNEATAADWYRKAAEKGSAEANVALGDLYCNGMKSATPVNWKDATTAWIAQAEKGDVIAQAKLGGMCYRNGFGVPRDGAKAIYWLEKAANQNVTDAMFKLSKIYSGDRDIPRDAEKAFYWAEKAALAGNIWAQGNLAQMYAQGRGTAKDPIKAEMWAQKAAEKGNNAGWTSKLLPEELLAAIKAGDPSAKDDLAKGAANKTKLAEICSRLAAFGETSNPWTETFYTPPTEVMKKLSGFSHSEETVSLRPTLEKYGIAAKKQVQTLDSCTLFATSTALELAYKSAGINLKPSIAYLNWVEGNGWLKRAEAKNGRAAGTNAACALIGARFAGICDEAMFPRDQIGKAPSAEAQAAAKLTRRCAVRGLAGFGPITVSRTEPPQQPYSPPKELLNQMIMEEIRAGRPVVIGLQFPRGVSKITMETAKGGTRKNRFPHAVLITGFTTKTGNLQDTTYEILNSWGKEWGDQGYGTLTSQWEIETAFSVTLD